VDSNAECVQLNLPHVARKKYNIKEETETNKRQGPLNPNPQTDNSSLYIGDNLFRKFKDVRHA